MFANAMYYSYCELRNDLKFNMARPPSQRSVRFSPPDSDPATCEPASPAEGIGSERDLPAPAVARSVALLADSSPALSGPAGY